MNTIITIYERIDRLVSIFFNISPQLTLRFFGLPLAIDNLIFPKIVITTIFCIIATNRLNRTNVEKLNIKLNLIMISSLLLLWAKNQASPRDKEFIQQSVGYFACNHFIWLLQYHLSHYPRNGIFAINLI
jgi:hypothetical protein